MRKEEEGKSGGPRMEEGRRGKTAVGWERTEKEEEGDELNE